MSDTSDRRRILRAAGATVGVGALSAAAALAASAPAPAATHDNDSLTLFTSPLIGTWRGIASRVDEVEVFLPTFYPGGIFTSFAEGIHISAGRWEMTGKNTFRFSLWQVLPDDLEGLPHRYHGEVQAVLEGRVDGDTLTSEGVGRQIDIHGNEVGRRGVVRAQATRFGIKPF